MSRVKAEVRRRREEAEDRQRAYNALSLETRLANLDRRPGSSKRERARLLLAIANKKA